MKSILITGAGSYVGGNLARWLARAPHRYRVETVDLRGDAWRAADFAAFDAVFHVAGIAHVTRNRRRADIYFRVNRDLAHAAAAKAKAAGVKQFIFMSSIIVYGPGRRIRGLIGPETTPAPADPYGESKLQAEQRLREIESDAFKVAIIRSPMVYGPGGKGNYPRLARLARRCPFFPDVDNRRSMIYIDNLCRCAQLLIDNEERGLFFPQNSEHVKTAALVQQIAAVHGRRVVLFRAFNPGVRVLARRIDLLDKLFGDLAYEHELSRYREDYRVVGFADSIRATERATATE